jgi:single-stranded-DNA-specific exonuclease
MGPPEISSGDVARLAHSLGVPARTARILVSRGRTDPKEARRFLEPGLEQLSSPFAFRGAEAAVERLLFALSAGQRILVFGDFDVDGVTGASLAVRALRKLGASVDYFMPKRLVHGYGLSKRVLPEILERRPSLFVTIDCGVRSVEEVDELRRAGIDTIVIDHHEPGPELPPALALIDPKQPGCAYPDKRLAGCGVAFQLLRGLVSRLEHEIDLAQDLDLVALGTVADVVPLDGENRVLVSEGLRVMNRREKVGVMELLAVSGVEARVDSWHLAYLLGPRINAAGRLGDASDAVELFLTNDTAAANEIARKLDQENLKRQEISSQTFEQALGAIHRGVAGESPDGIVLASNSWHPGVIGIATAKLVEKFHRPSALIAMDGDTGRGSVRSIRGVDVCAVLSGCEDLLLQFGGHEMAAGLTIERDKVAAFRERFAAGVAEQLTEENASPRLKIDDVIHADDVDVALAEELDRLSPFGYGNRRPTFIIRSPAMARGVKIVGRGHLKFSLRKSDGSELDCIGFELSELAEGFPLGNFEVAGHVAVNEWNGNRTAQFQVLDARRPVS